MPVDLVVRNGTIVTSTATFEGGVAVENGKIVALGREGELPVAHHTLDARGRYILPGLIDAHVHFRDPGLEYKEDFTTGSTAAAFGGVTLVLDMPNTNPVTGDAEVVRLRERLISEKSYIDIVLVGVIVPENLDQIEPMAQAGVVGYKVYLGESVGHISTPDDGQLIDALTKVAELGLRVGFHAETNEILQHYTSQLRRAGRQDPMAFIESRPVVCEVESIQRVALFAHYTGAKIHILHLSSKDGAIVIREWRNKGVDITSETCPHYLFLPAEQYMNALGSKLRVNPPVRSSEHSYFLYNAILDGTVDMITTDHAPHTREEKLNPNIWQASSGLLGVETVVPLMLSEAVNKRGMSLNHLVKLCAENPAKVWGLWPRKGSLQIGADADLTIVDLNQQWTIDENQLHSKNKISPWHSWSGTGKPVATIVRGQLVMQDGQLAADRPGGQMIRPLVGKYGQAK